MQILTFPHHLPEELVAGLSFCKYFVSLSGIAPDARRRDESLEAKWIQATSPWFDQGTVGY